MIRQLIAPVCVLSLLACGTDDVANQESAPTRTASVQLSVGTESAFLTEQGYTWTKESRGLYSRTDDSGKYQAAFGLDGAISALQLAQKDYADSAKLSADQRARTPSLRPPAAQLERVVAFWQKVVDTRVANSAGSGDGVNDLWASGHCTSSGGSCTVSVLATVVPSHYCVASASAVYTGIFGPGLAGSGVAIAGTEIQKTNFAPVNVSASSLWPCDLAFAAATMGEVSLTVTATAP